MPVINEGRRSAEFILSEASGTRSRDAVTIASGSGKLEAGAVLGKITASGKFKAYDNAASDGSQAAAGVLYAEVDATASDVKATAIVRDAEVKRPALIFAGSQVTADQSAAVVDLTALGIIAR